MTHGRGLAEPTFERQAGLEGRFEPAIDGAADVGQCRAVAAGNVPGAFWAGLTHPRCAPELEERMCRDLHMIQHQAGACARARLAGIAVRPLPERLLAHLRIPLRHLPEEELIDESFLCSGATLLVRRESSSTSRSSIGRNP